MANVQFYEDNILNGYDNYTYNWKIIMVRPEDVAKYDEVLKTKRFKVIAHSGVESEVNIQSVTHEMKLSFNKQLPDREAVANVFSANLIEPLGSTLYTRIYKAARDLNITNHLKAAYLLQLNFLGYLPDGTPVEKITQTYNYMCTLTGLDFSYRDGATQYRADFMETTQDAFKKLALHLKSEISITASNYGGVLGELSRLVNEQEKEQTLSSTVKRFWHEYTLTTGADVAEWQEWAFDTGAGNSEENPDFAGVSVTGDGTLTFKADQGSSISDLMIIGLMHTTKFRKLPTAKNAFHKENPNDAVALKDTFADLSKWFTFDTDVVYDVFDVLSRDYKKKFTYKIDGFIVPELVHDNISFMDMFDDQKLQEDRLGNIVSNDLLKKRFDYTFTGLNTEVLNLDIYLNNTYYTLQALNQGERTKIGQTFAGEGGPDQELNQIESDRQGLRNKITENQNKISALKQKVKANNDQIENLSGAEGSEIPEAESAIGSIVAENTAAQAEIVDLESQNEALEVDIKKLVPEQEKLTLEKEAADRLKQGDLNSLNSGENYIRQQDIIGQPRNDKFSNPHVFDISHVNSKATNGPDEGDTSGAVLLGAVEINLNAMTDLAVQQIEIRGDPYWLGRPKSRQGKRTGKGANYTRGGVSYFLNLNLPTYPEDDGPETGSGLMNIPEANFAIIGLYRVHSVVARYSDGQFTMTLDSFRDQNTNIGRLWTFLSKGQMPTGDKRTTEPLNLPEGEDELDIDTTPQVDTESIGDPVDGNVVTPNVTESQSNVASVRKLSIASDLKAILQTAASRTGVNVDVRSGGQDSSTGFTGSTRHNNGHAADVALTLADGTRLTTTNPQHLPIITNFLAEAKKAGATGIGAGNGYMGNNTFHIDNAQQYGQGNAGYWGGQLDGGTFRSRNAPGWLRDIFTA